MKWHKLTQNDLDRELRCLFAADGADPVEFVVRSGVIFASTLALWAATGSILMLLWGLGYLVVNGWYVRCINRTATPVSRGRLMALLGMSSFVAMWFTAMVFFLASLGEMHFVLLALCGCCGLALHSLARNDGLSLGACIDLFTTVLSTCGVLFFAMIHAPSMMSSVTILVGGLSILVYYIISFFQIIAVRRRLAETLRAEGQSQKLRSLGQLTAGIAHDFNNLLTVIGGNIELFELDHPAVDSDGYLAEARAATERSAVLISNLLAYARKSKMHSARHSIGHLLDRVDGMLMRVLPANIAFTVKQPDTPVEVEVDKAMFESAILNLVINARDALDAQPGSICIETSISPDGGTLILNIDDDGPGMDPAILAEATDPFFTTKDVGRGSGLGLSMVQGFAEQSGGTFVLSNRSPRGLNARLSLPIQRSRSAPEGDVSQLWGSQPAV